MRKKPNLQQRIETCRDLLIDKPELLKGRWLTEYPGYDGIHLELGCGKGKFTAQTALECPEILHVAMERIDNVLISAMERARSEQVGNVLFLHTDARDIAGFFSPGEVGRIYINFCDPWPKNRDAGRRLTSPGFLRLYRNILRPGDEIHFKTDNDDLFDYSLNCFSQEGFEPAEISRDLHAGEVQGVTTDYEERFVAMGVNINRCVAILKSNVSGTGTTMEGES
jgi:tRNA (guanine-N7-)-methyltransferase